ncbi:membrane protein [Pseudomonas piscis]|nr:membrane protein [Pseudomonas piscis]
MLLVSIAMGLVFAGVLGAAFRPQIEALSQELIKILPMALGEVYQQLSVEERARLATLIAPILTGLIAALLQAISVLSLILGRYWQAVLYNPGGFGREFRAIRIPLGPAMLLLACMLVGPSFGPQLAMLTPMCSVPLAFAGLALIHGLVAQGRLARFWLVGVYITMLPFMQLIYPLLVVLAIVDSLIDFRGRLAPKDADNGSANGEG